MEEKLNSIPNNPKDSLPKECHVLWGECNRVLRTVSDRLSLIAQLDKNTLLLTLRVQTQALEN
ncbi:hypothetical protein NQ317_009356 [Molorchus minor]|uniref:Uncharacterized protein n=1 Tax=Molorchus minor TaxID=1323400 RepID=A0ABQ9JLN8_9CUCU|nr:hypothetical protein NQ317_009356 [Molorchus minor]